MSDETKEILGLSLEHEALMVRVKELEIDGDLVSDTYQSTSRRLRWVQNRLAEIAREEPIPFD